MEMTRRIPFLKEFEQGGCFDAFTTLVRTHDELELLFRGNSGSNGEAIIYFCNNVVFKLAMSKDGKKGKIIINYNHLRYTERWQETIKEYAEYGFPLKDVENIKPKENYGIGYVYADVDLNKKIDQKYVEGLYGISRRVMEDYFCLDKSEKRIDRFRESFGVPQTGRAKPNYLEKVNQQAFFAATSKTRNGLFVYDLEYKEPFADSKKKSEAMRAKNRENMNKPDCLAIRFDEHGCPVSFAFVEMKSKKEAEEGKSGTGEHLDGMMDDLLDKEFVRLRIKEANQIIHDYQSLELKGIKKSDSIPNIEDYIDDMKTEIIIVYTNESAKGRKAGQYIAESRKYKDGISYSVELF